MPPWPKIVLLALASGALQSQEQAAGHDTWKVYTNVRFNYKICYPDDLLIPQGEAANSDGQTFLAKDGAKLLVFGRNNALNQTLKNALDDTAARLAGRSGKVTYKVMKPGWFVLSGQDRETMFYAKMLYADDQFKSFELTYGSSQSAIYKPVAGRLTGCFASLTRR